jgi:hypothetical protein
MLITAFSSATEYPAVSDSLSLENGSKFLGVYLNADEASALTESKLQSFRSSGIRVIQIPDHAPASISELIGASGFRWIIEHQNPFYFHDYRSDADSLLIAEFHQNARARYTNTTLPLIAVNLFQYPYETDNASAAFMSRMAGIVREHIDVPLFYVSGIENERVPVVAGFNFTSHAAGVNDQPEGSGFYHFYPDYNSDFASLSALKNLMEVTTASQGQSVILIPADWLLTITEKHPFLRSTFPEYSSTGQVIFPLPADSSATPSINWSVILLMIVLGSYIVHYRYQPVYKRSISRYFTNHKFFVDDILEYRTRSFWPGFILLTQHAFLCGITAYLASKYFFSDAGLQALFHHLPLLALFVASSFSFFIWGFLISIVLQAVSVVWIFILNKKLKALVQAIHLYCWPLHLNLLVVMLMVSIYSANPDSGLLPILILLFPVIWFFSFNVAAIDAAKALRGSGIFYLILTVGIHVLLISALLFFLFYTPLIYKSVYLAALL